MAITSSLTSSGLQLVNDEMSVASLNNNLMGEETEQTDHQGALVEFVESLAKFVEKGNDIALRTYEAIKDLVKSSTSFAETQDEQFDYQKDRDMEADSEAKKGEAKFGKTDEDGGGFLAAIVAGLIAMKTFVVKKFATMPKLIGSVFTEVATMFKGAVKASFTGVMKLLTRLRTYFKPVAKLVKSLTSIGAKITKVFSYIGKLSSFVGKIFAPITKLLPVVGKASGFLKAIPIVGNVIMAVMALFDGIKGWFAAADISGKTEGELTLADKVLASISSIISGLSFGLLDVKKIFSFLSESWTTFKDGFAKVVDFISGLLSGDEATWSSISDMFQSAITSIFDYIRSIPEKIVSYVSSIFENISEAFNKLKSRKTSDFVPEGIKNSWIGKKLFGESEAEAVGEAAQVSSKVEAVTPMAMSRDTMLSKQRFEERQSKATQTSQQAPVIINASEERKSTPSLQVTSIDDMGLNFMNTAMVE